MTDYSFDAVGEQMKKMLDNAIQTYLFEHEWIGTPTDGFEGSGWDTRLPRVSAAHAGTIQLRFNMMSQTRTARIPPGARYVKDEQEGYLLYQVYELDPYVDIYEPIIDRVNKAFLGWRTLPDPADFAAVKGVLADVVDELTPDEQQDGSYSFVDVKVQSAIELMNKWVSPQGQQASSDLLFAFDSAYGVGRITGVMTNQAQVAAGLGLAVAGEEQVWTKARADLMAIAVDGAEALRWDGGGGGTIDLGVVKAFVDLVKVFTPASLGILMDGLSAGIGFLQEVIPEQTTEKKESTISGGSAMEVLANIEKAVSDLESAIFNEEQEIAKKMRKLGEIIGSRNAEDFHIHPGAGVDETFAKAAEIRINVDMVRTIGTRDVPTIAGAFLDAADLASGQTGSGIWSREQNIGYGSIGPHTPWNARMSDLDAMATGSARELVEAGRRLAIAAGWVEDSDISSHSAISDHKDELDRGKYEWSASS
ncbi:hypothetical protein [Nocardioides sp. GXZ039]|uniref:hypothetical protein n=1 Tax=Nocardioides sp. GXZ039 TaxID=3136018 RepID=UPI0030F423C4